MIIQVGMIVIDRGFELLTEELIEVTGVGYGRRRMSTEGRKGTNLN